ncbi:hypothetical protein ZIOFF_062583 [Zingiber officinale]|uniref:Uncharacterized protein n=1 Tax=Zingiber officinale TaxID=94328 RepID=A0A8J5F0J3_ZINOF|nr:hypothetical protein ZIOFF_062583 [Zingiber officinale]
MVHFGLVGTPPNPAKPINAASSPSCFSSVRTAAEQLGQGLFTCTQLFKHGSQPSQRTPLASSPPGSAPTSVPTEASSALRHHQMEEPPPPPTVVSAIDLKRYHLAAPSVRGFIDDLPDLAIFHANSNRFGGTVPDLSRLPFFYELDLSNNLFSGPFPAAALLIPNLLYLDLRFNSFSGELPDDIFEKPLDAIFLNDNHFQGRIPASLWASTASVITLANNHFSGDIPPTFGSYMINYSGVRELLLLNNDLTGCIPDAVGFLGAIQVLDLSFNSLSGHVPSSVSCLADIEVLNLAHNQLSGDLPELVCGLKELLNLTVSFNFFSGLSAGCNRLQFSRGVGFEFAGNCIAGKDFQRPPLQCSEIPGAGLSCLGMPAAAAEAAACGRFLGQGSIGFSLNLSALIPQLP